MAFAAKCTLKENVLVHHGEDKTFVFTAIARNELGDVINAGGDTITTKWRELPGAGRYKHKKYPNIHVEDLNSGEYKLSFLAETDGRYIVEVFINGKMMPQRMIAMQQCERMEFDPAHCEKGVLLSEGRRTATCKAQNHKFRSVLGKHGMRWGQHSWKIQLHCSPQYCYHVGIATRRRLVSSPGLDHCLQSWSWVCGTHRQVMHTRRQCCGTHRPLWEKGDVVHLDLDCDNHVIQLTNTRTGRKDVIRDLPDKEFFPFCDFACFGDRMCFVD